MNRPALPLDGLLVLDKPRGWTSHDVVARVRRLTGERRAGHAGTLDPLATGVLALGLGQGTRVLEYLSEAGKTYRAIIRLGISTDTYDADGTVVASVAVPRLTQPEIDAALTPFRGTFEQRPPRFSALKRDGRPLYAYARAGLPVDPAPRTVHVEKLRLLTYTAPDLEIELTCSSGFYVRSLAHDVGQALGCGAHLRELVRTRAGPFTLEEATTLTALANAAAEGTIFAHLWALDAPLRRWPAVILAGPHLAEVANGRPLRLAGDAAPPGELCRTYSTAGELVALLAFQADGRARPVKVFPEGRRGPNLSRGDCPIVV